MKFLTLLMVHYTAVLTQSMTIHLTHLVSNVKLLTLLMVHYTAVLTQSMTILLTHLVSNVKFLNFRTPENFAVIYLKLKQRGQTLGISSK